MPLPFAFLFIILATMPKLSRRYETSSASFLDAEKYLTEFPVLSEAVKLPSPE